MKDNFLNQNNHSNHKVNSKNQLLLIVVTLIIIVLSSCTKNHLPKNNSSTANSVKNEVDDVEQYTARINSISSPNKLTILNRPTSKQGFAQYSSVENSQELFDGLKSLNLNPAIMSAARAAKVDDLMRVHILNIGAGSCQIVECPGLNKIIVADCGSKKPSDTDMTRGQIASYLNEINPPIRVIQ